MSAVLEARGLCAGYDGGAVVRDLDLVVEPGEIVALLGRNGAGKTTTLRTLSGILRPHDGEVWIDGRRSKGGLQHRAKLGLALVPDDRGVFYSLTTAENLRLGKGSAQRALDIFPELAPLMGTRAGLLSGGQQQMLALGRALAANPTMLLVDELSIGLAPIVVRRLLKAVRQAADAGTAILLIEQHARLALSVADRGYVLQNGRLVLSGSAETLGMNVADVERAYLALPEA